MRRAEEGVTNNSNKLSVGADHPHHHNQRNEVVSAASSPVAVSPSQIVRPTTTLRKARVCVWTDFSRKDVERLGQACTNSQLKTALCDIVPEVCNHERPHQAAILMDLFLHAVLHAREQRFNEQQTSTFLALLSRLHHMATETPFDNMRLCFSYFKEMLLSHSVFRPPFCADIFGVDDAEAVMRYAMQTYFKHFWLYKYAFTPRLEMDVLVDYAENRFLEQDGAESDEITVLGDEDDLLQGVGGETNESSVDGSTNSFMPSE